jgi:hypothetical protein
MRGDALVPVALTFAVLSVERSALALGGVLAALLLARVVFTLLSEEMREPCSAAPSRVRIAR